MEKEKGKVKTEAKVKVVTRRDCEAKGCPASSPYHPLCKSCHRKGLEGSGHVINKWDQKIEVGKKEFSRSDKKAFKAFKEEKKRERDEVRMRAAISVQALRFLIDWVIEDQFLPR